MFFRMKTVGATAAIVCGLLAGCEASETQDKKGPHENRPQAVCTPGELPAAEGSCGSRGLPPDVSCPPGEALVGDACQPAGVPPSACAAGFEPDGGSGCEPVLPAAPCGKGMMAVPGDVECHEPSACSGKEWGELPEGKVLFVDAAAPAGGDGTELQPLVTIQAALEIAEPWTTIAIAPGVYEEKLIITTPGLYLTADCSATTTLGGTPSAPYAIDIEADDVRIAHVSIAGPNNGILVNGVENVVLDGVLVHDTGAWGIYVTRSSGKAGQLQLNDSLIEDVVESGVQVLGSTVALSHSVVKGTIATPGSLSAGISAEQAALHPAHVEVVSSVISDNAGTGIVGRSSEILIQASVVERSKPAPGSGYGMGIYSVTLPNKPVATVDMDASVLRDNMVAAVALGDTDATIKSSVVRGNSVSGGASFTVLATADPDTESGAKLEMQDCKIEDNEQMGIYISGSIGTIVRTLVRNTHYNQGGYGILVDSDIQRSSVDIVDSTIVANESSGIAVSASDLTLVHSRVSDTIPNAIKPELGGVGVSATPDLMTGQMATLTIDRSLLEGNAGGGVIAFESDLTLRSSRVAGTKSVPGDPNGNGVIVQADEGSPLVPHLVVDGCEIADNAGVGVSSFRAVTTVQCSRIERNAQGGVGVVGGTSSVRANIVQANQLAGLLMYGGENDVSCMQIDDTKSLDAEYGGGAFVATGRLAMSDSSVFSSRYNGIAVLDADLTLTRVTINTVADQEKDQRFGDGVAIVSIDATAEAVIEDTTIQGCARAGIATFGGLCHVSGVDLQCNAFDIDQEDLGGHHGAFSTGGDVQCGCPTADQDCQALREQLEAPNFPAPPVPFALVIPPSP